MDYGMQNPDFSGFTPRGRSILIETLLRGRSKVNLLFDVCDEQSAPSYLVAQRSYTATVELDLNGYSKKIGVSQNANEESVRRVASEYGVVDPIFEGDFPIAVEPLLVELAEDGQILNVVIGAMFGDPTVIYQKERGVGDVSHAGIVVDKLLHQLKRAASTIPSFAGDPSESEPRLDEILFNQLTFEGRPISD